MRGLGALPRRAPLRGTRQRVGWWAGAGALAGALLALVLAAPAGWLATPLAAGQ